MDNDELIHRATSTYLKWCKSKGFILDQPSSYSSDVNRNIITLRNCNGILARYKYSEEKDRLQRLKR